VIVGYCYTGRAVMATKPARQRMIAMTVAKMGRSMKNLENTNQDSFMGTL
jgi:hypothetical protein